jgi:pyruvate dehydrogenase E2 component (dihydrolipoamide acetyltransferase)
VTAPRGISGYEDPRGPLATPATRKSARDLKVDLRRVPPTGAGGRVTKDDVEAYSSAGGLSAPQAPGLRALPSRPTRKGRAIPAGGTRLPFVGIRRRIAENMALSKNTAAHFSFVEECACDRLIELRDRLRHG